MENGGNNILSYIDHTMRAYLRRNIIFPLYWKYIRRLNVLKYYQELRIHQWNTLEENKKIQQKKLYKLIEYANTNIPITNGSLKSIIYNFQKIPYLRILKNFLF